MSNSVILSYERVAEIINDRLNISSKNTACCAVMGRDKIRPFVGSINRIDKEPLFILTPKSSTKGTPEWTHDITSFKIYKIDSSYLKLNNISTYGKDFSDKLEIILTDDILAYNSDSGTIVSDSLRKDLTAREFACLMLQLPNSGTPWLDELINYKLKKNG